MNVLWHRHDKTPEERFWDKVDRLDTGCWEWTGHKDKYGYGSSLVQVKNPKGLVVKKRHC